MFFSENGETLKAKPGAPGNTLNFTFVRLVDFFTFPGCLKKRQNFAPLAGNCENEKKHAFLLTLVENIF